jgi:hypothetical protein
VKAFAILIADSNIQPGDFLMKRKSAFQPSNHTLYEVTFHSYRQPEHSDDLDWEKVVHIPVVLKKRKSSLEVLKSYVAYRGKKLNPESIEGQDGDGSFARATYTTRNTIFPDGHEYEISVERQTSRVVYFRK